MPLNTVKDDEQLKEVMNIKIIARLLKYLKPYKLSVVKALSLIALIVCADLANPYMLKLGIDKYMAMKDSRGLLILGGILLALNTVSLICSRKRIKLMASMTNNILLNIRQELYTHIQKLTFTFFDGRPTGKILARVIGDVNSLNELFTNCVTTLIPDFTILICVAAIMMSLNLKLALLALALLPVMMVTMFIFRTHVRRRWQVYRKKNSNLNAFTHEDFSGIRVVQSFAAEGYTEGIFRKLLNEHRGAFVSAVKIGDLFWPLVDFSWGFGSILVYWYGVTLINNGMEGITVGLLVAFTGYISMFWRPIMNLSNFYNQLITNLSAAERIFEILDIEPDISNSKMAGEMPVIKGRVEFRNVSFGYAEDKKVLDNVCFKVMEGQTVALVGPTGAGKTTIVSLIARFYEVNSGEVLIDNINVKDVTLDSLRSQMGIMTQDTFLFSGSIRDNIAYGKLDATEEEIIAAAKAVNAHDFIMALEKGYDTNVNERGARLSVGQRQLISFARAMLANPRILILDEATASIDTHTERLVQQGIKELLKGRTSFVIAHRLSTIQEADVIMVIDDGRITEAGTHGELLQVNGIYSRLYNAQFAE